jgi:hypothetical protein
MHMKELVLSMKKRLWILNLFQFQPALKQLFIHYEKAVDYNFFSYAPKCKCIFSETLESDELSPGLL